MRHLFGIEARVNSLIAPALLQNRVPAQAGLCPFQNQKFEPTVVIVDRQGTTFALNATVFHARDDGGDFVSMTDRDTLRSVLARPPGDVRALIPRGEGA